MKTGDYYKLVGDHAGAVWTGTRWERFDCEACVRGQGIAKNRLQGPMSNGASKVMHGPVIHRHNVQVHQEYLSKARAAARKADGNKPQPEQNK